MALWRILNKSITQIKNNLNKPNPPPQGLDGLIHHFLILLALYFLFYCTNKDKETNQSDYGQIAHLSSSQVTCT